MTVQNYQSTLVSFLEFSYFYLRLPKSFISFRYMKEDVEDTDLPGLPPKQLTKIKSKMKSSWFKSLMLKKKVT